MIVILRISLGKIEKWNCLKFFTMTFKKNWIPWIKSKDVKILSIEHYKTSLKRVNEDLNN